MALPKSIVSLSEDFSRLPGVGYKLSSKIALYLSVTNKKLAEKIKNDISDVMQNISECDICRNITDENICEICRRDDRDYERLMIIENSLDLYSIEQFGDYQGRYHVLGGLISPVNGISPDDLNIPNFLDRVASDSLITEIIFALSTNLEGESTSIYIKNEIEARGIDNLKFTRLARGIPMGSSLEYVSNQTIADSIIRRSEF